MNNALKAVPIIMALPIWAILIWGLIGNIQQRSSGGIVLFSFTFMFSLGSFIYIYINKDRY